MPEAELHRQALKSLLDRAPANFSCLISIPSPTHQAAKHTQHLRGLWASARVDPGWKCPSSPLCPKPPRLRSFPHPRQIKSLGSLGPHRYAYNSREPQSGIPEPVSPQHGALRRAGARTGLSVQGKDRAHRAWASGTRDGGQGSPRSSEDGERLHGDQSQEGQDLADGMPRPHSSAPQILSLLFLWVWGLPGHVTGLGDLPGL